jgi:DNA-directed RNA polymerase subunit M/transcription elongation factor TFIIS
MKKVCPRCFSKNVRLLEDDYWSPEADELRVYEYECLDCGHVWEVEWE